ncbi:class I SAM-dependent methyltransferase [Mycobacteroides salmoniphilum]|uniref:class I SAM-dependent methyltransferase n=1 Tax=Mycobacteroides salmoniphilum TaxID=404941 RepID=UPI0010662106|nr:class I SAM-dependent methyltransferase [Mycobacteroides salmoniphilum]TDZ91382.1 putative S-adenosyl-L-methionine-dependent methyltransferase [Mycobacteroides salmoniphilum]
MARTEGDTWDIVSSVGATALGVAAMRAIEARRPRPLACDEYAQYFVAATKEAAPVFSEFVENPDIASEPDIELFSSAMGARTRYFDEFFLDASTAGIQQAVILASGLDVRGYRLPWPDGTVVHELDQPKVLEFKKQVLDQHGVRANAAVVALPVDLRSDWPEALKAKGFDASCPTAWSAEGLLAYLPGAAQDLLFERIADLSAPGSRLATEDLPPERRDARLAAQTALHDGALRRMISSIVDKDAGEDMSSLWFTDERADPLTWLTGHGWTVSAVTTRELLVRHNRSIPAEPHEISDGLIDSRYLTAIKPA